MRVSAYDWFQNLNEETSLGLNGKVKSKFSSKDSISNVSKINGDLIVNTISSLSKELLKDTDYTIKPVLLDFKDKNNQIKGEAGAIVVISSEQNNSTIELIIHAGEYGTLEKSIVCNIIMGYSVNENTLMHSVHRDELIPIHASQFTYYKKFGFENKNIFNDVIEDFIAIDFDNLDTNSISKIKNVESIDFSVFREKTFEDFIEDTRNAIKSFKLQVDKIKLEYLFEQSINSNFQIYK